jgi:hypothetical protein
MHLEPFVNEADAPMGALSCAEWTPLGRNGQPAPGKKHRPVNMSLIRALLALLAASFALPLAGQSTAPAASGPASVSATLNPALTQVQQAISNLNIRHWKAPNEVRAAADQDVSSIQRDLGGTLAGLVQQADAAPGSIPPAFAVYRNVDALYDTLLRVVLTANLAASDEEANALQGALTSLESARSQVGETILQASAAQQTALAQARAALAKAAQAPSPPVKTTVIDDGPTNSPPKAKHTTKKPSTGSNSTKTGDPNSGNSSPH